MLMTLVWLLKGPGADAHDAGLAAVADAHDAGLS